MADGDEFDEWLDVVSALSVSSDVDINVFGCDLGPVRPSTIRNAAARGWLDAHDVEAVERQRTVRLRGLTAARRVLRRFFVAAACGARPEHVSVESRCTSCGDRSHGRPMIRTASDRRSYLSTSSTRDAYVVAIANHRIGVDLEECRSLSGLPSPTIELVVPGWGSVASYRGRRMTDIERWTALEAVTKSTGIGLIATQDEVQRTLERSSLRWFEHRGAIACVASAHEDPTMFVHDVTFGSECVWEDALGSVEQG